MTLPRARSDEGRAGLAAILADPANSLIAADFDGTLSPIVSEPDEARPVAAGLAALRSAADTFGQVAVITGRPATWVADVAGLGAVPRLLICGQYGAERWSDGVLTAADPLPGLASVREELPGIVGARQARIEDKGLSVVVHTRQAEHPDAELAALIGPLRALAQRHGLTAHPGRFVLEIRPPGYDKGGALAGLIEEYEVRAVLFAGDDLGDLAGFAEVERRRAADVPGVTVCSASTEAPEVADRADIVVDGPQGVAALLAALVAAAAR